MIDITNDESIDEECLRLRKYCLSFLNRNIRQYNYTSQTTTKVFLLFNEIFINFKKPYAHADILSVLPFPSDVVVQLRNLRYKLADSTVITLDDFPILDECTLDTPNLSF